MNCQGGDWPKSVVSNCPVVYISRAFEVKPPALLSREVMVSAEVYSQIHSLLFLPSRPFPLSVSQINPGSPRVQFILQIKAKLFYEVHSSHSDCRVLVQRLQFQMFLSHGKWPRNPYVSVPIRERLR